MMNAGRCLVYSAVSGIEDAVRERDGDDGGVCSRPSDDGPPGFGRRPGDEGDDRGRLGELMTFFTVSGTNSRSFLLHVHKNELVCNLHALCARLHRHTRRRLFEGGEWWRTFLGLARTYFWGSRTPGKGCHVSPPLTRGKTTVFPRWWDRFPSIHFDTLLNTCIAFRYVFQVYLNVSHVSSTQVTSSAVFRMYL